MMDPAMGMDPNADPNALPPADASAGALPPADQGGAQMGSNGVEADPKDLKKAEF
jgi:hypothetical protein